MKKTILFFASVLCLFIACNDEKDLYEGYWVDELNDISKAYMYSFQSEKNAKTAEITIDLNENINTDDINVEIPHLKYNKELLVMFTQDDCKHAAFSTTWAAINGKPLSYKFYYDYVHYLADDLPSDTTNLNKTLGYTDGTGKEVRFSFTTTLLPEADWMDAETGIALRPTNDNFRFYMKNGLNWRNVIAMLNYDIGIAFHDVLTEDVNNVDSIVKHYGIAQNIILDKLRGRGCKVLAEPNGNKTYIRAAWKYDPIQIMTAQNTKDGITVEKLYPFKVDNDLKGELYERSFVEPAQVRTDIQAQLSKPQKDREDVHIGLHGTDYNWTNLLVWINDNYGKDGTDIVWIPSYEEYYEYMYNRANGTISKTIEGNKLKIKYTFPEAEYFYFPSTTINITGLDKSNVKSVTVNDVVKGLSHAGYDKGYMINIDCRNGLVEHATRFVEEYEAKKNDISLKNDALYYVNKLKDSSTKTALLNRLK